jgi:hypothetical protein
MNAKLFNAILSMDSYNRGYNAKIILSGVGSSIGNSTYITDSMLTPNTSSGGGFKLLCCGLQKC